MLPCGAAGLNIRKKYLVTFVRGMRSTGVAQMEDYERTEEEDEHWGIDHLKAEAAKDSSADEQSAAAVGQNTTELEGKA